MTNVELFLANLKKILFKIKAICDQIENETITYKCYLFKSDIYYKKKSVKMNLFSLLHKFPLQHRKVIFIVFRLDK